MAIATLFGALNVGVSGLFVSRAATNMINHNIANANTPGYSRQYLDVQALTPVQSPFGSLGRGAGVMGVTRLTDSFVEQNLFQQTSLLGTYASIDDSLRNVEGILGGVDNDRLGDSLSAFFDSWSELANAPEDSGRRQNVVRRAEALAFQFRDIATSLRAEERTLYQKLETQIDDANALMQRVGELNSSILASGGASAAGDLVDQRNLMLAKLSEIVSFTTHQRGDGSLDVIVQGRSMVTRNVVQELSLDSSRDADGVRRARVHMGENKTLEIPLQSGTVAGLLRSMNEILPDIRADLDAVAMELKDRVNALHRDGVTPSGSGLDLFLGESAADLEVVNAIAADSSLLASGRSGEAGDNEIATAIAALRDTISDDDGKTLGELALDLIVGVATERGSFQTLLEGQVNVVEGVAARLEETRGVNVDEELTYLLQYQRAFEANARVIQSVDQMLDTLINRMI